MPRIAITMGDPAGVGPEICLRLLADPRIADLCVPIVFGDVEVLRQASEATRLPPPPDHRAFHGDLSICRELDRPTVLDIRALEGRTVTPGRVSAGTGRASYAYIDAAIEAALGKHVDAVTTGPIHKKALHEAGICYPGHTEIFVERTGVEQACMMLTSDTITCSFVTTHVGYHEVPGLLSEARITEVIDLSVDALRRFRGRAPRLVVCALNPHAGEDGLFGNREEERIIRPAVEAARQRGIDIEGPLPPDTAFLPERRATTDCFVCMYHDQGHIPLKALAFDLAVNITLGLPIIRTSVDHGTACDIAWQGKAGVSSLYEATRLAARLAGQPTSPQCEAP